MKISRQRWPLLTGIVLGACALLGPRVSAGQTSAYVPSADPAYRDVDALVAAGLVRTLIVGTRPWSRATFSAALAEATTRLSAPRIAGDTAGRVASRAPKRRILEAVDRLRQRFSDEPPSGIHGARLDATTTDSPLRAVHAMTGHDAIDADVAPLVQRNNGRLIPNGTSVAGEVWGDMRLGAHVVASVQPRVALALPRDGGHKAELQLVTGYARAGFGNLAIDIGRNTLARGTSDDASPTLSTNARGLDLIRVSMERPAKLPGLLRYLGPTKFAGAVAALGNNRDNPGGALIVWEASIRPHANVELGMTLVAQQGGRGTPSATFGKRVLDALFIARRALPITHFLWQDPQISDKWFGADARLTVPGTGLDAYVEFGTTDDDDLFVARPGKALWNEAAWLGGVRWRALGPEGRLDVWTEAAHNGVDAYTHLQYTSGLTLDRRMLGSPLGPLATSIRGGAQWTAPADRVSMTAAWEQYDGDLYGIGNTRDGYRRVQDNVDEVRARVTLDWERMSSMAPRLSTTARAGYERVSHHAFTDATRSNFLVQMGLAWVW